MARDSPGALSQKREATLQKRDANAPWPPCDGTDVSPPQTSGLFPGQGSGTTLLCTSAGVRIMYETSAWLFLSCA